MRGFSPHPPNCQNAVCVSAFVVHIHAQTCLRSLFILVCWLSTQRDPRFQCAGQMFGNLLRCLHRTKPRRVTTCFIRGNAMRSDKSTAYNGYDVRRGEFGSLLAKHHFAQPLPCSRTPAYGFCISFFTRQSLFVVWSSFVLWP